MFLCGRPTTLLPSAQMGLRLMLPSTYADMRKYHKQARGTQGLESPTC